MRWPFRRIPALGRGLPSKYAEGTAVFDARVKAHFPLEMDEAAFLGELRKQGYKPDPYVPELPDFGSATFYQGVIFVTLWSIRWRVREGRIVEVFGIYGCIAP